MIKLLSIGDLHSKKNNQSVLLECAKRICNKIKEHKPKAITILGDLANDHEKLYVVALNGIVSVLDLICETATSVGAKVYYIVGNHDATTNQIFLTPDHSFNAFKKWPNLIVVDKPIRFKSSDGYITMCPYVPPGRFVEALDTLGRDKWMESMVIFCHQEFAGVKMGAIESSCGDNWGIMLPLVVSGHIHTYHQHRDNILYVGAPYDINFGDEGEKGVHVLEFENGALVGHLMDNLGMPRKQTIKLTINEAMEYQVPENHQIRAYISGTTQEFTKFKKTEKFEKLSALIKIIPQITDPAKVIRNVSRKGYLDILKEECLKENAFVRLIFDEITQKGEQN